MLRAAATSCASCTTGQGWPVRPRICKGGLQLRFGQNAAARLYTPAELKGRTMFFDWLEVDGPPQGQAEIKFQLITVPGQVQRNYRRRPLVEMADVVVFVCDCTPGAAP